MANSPKLQSVLDAAQAASDNFQAPAVIDDTPSTAVAVAQPRKMSLDELADNSGMAVDAYLTVKEAGFRVGDGGEYFKTFKAKIDVTEVVVIASIRATLNGATNFYKSYDGVTTSTGMSFAQAKANEDQRGSRVDVYNTVEIPVELLETVPGLEEGKRLGITPAITGVKLWTAFYDKLRQQGLSSATVDVQITCKPQKNKKGNEWGIAEFVLIGESDTEE